MKKSVSKKILKILTIAAVVILSASLVLSIVGVIGANANLEMARRVKRVEIRRLTLEKDGLGYWSFTNEQDTSFKILQLTDIHIGAGFMSIGKDKMALEAVKKLVNHTKPDLIIVTGDMVYPMPVQSGTTNNRRATEMFGTLMSGFGIPWTVVYGNHDEEWYSIYKKDTLDEMYASFPNSIFQPGPKELTGSGNTFINIKNADGSLNTSLALIDSNSYVSKYGLTDYDCIHEDQIDWYADELLRIRDHYELSEYMPSLAFFHIPVEEFADAWRLHKQGDSQATYHYGRAGEKNEAVCSPAVEGAIFDKMVELGSTKAIFCGHDHLNDFQITYKGIRLTYGKSIDYLAYIGIKKSTFQRGALVIEIAPDSSFEITPVVLADIA